MFDCDGTLLETESRWTIAEREICARRGVPFTMELKRRLLGTHIDLAGRILADWVGAPADDAPALAGAFIVAYRDALDANGVDPMPGALELVGALAGRVPLAVASNTQVEDTRRVLARSSLPDAFTAIVCAGDGIRPKPAPDVYLAACAALGTDPAATVAIEDSPVGVRAAVSAGLVVYGVASTPGVSLDAPITLGSLLELDADRLLRPPS